MKVALPPDPKVDGIDVSGTLTLDPKPGGSVNGTVQAALPPILGGGEGTLTVTSTYGKGVTAMTLAADHAKVAGLFTVTEPTLSWENGAWSVKGNVIVPTGGTVDLEGTLTYSSDNLLSTGDLTVDGLSLADSFGSGRSVSTTGEGPAGRGRPTSAKATPTRPSHSSTPRTGR